MEPENTVKQKEQEPAEEKAPKGGLFSMGRMDRYIRYAAFVVAVGLVYIYNSHYAEELLQEEARLQRELDQVMAEFKTIDARVSGLRRRYVVETMADSLLGLKAFNEPPYVIEVDDE